MLLYIRNTKPLYSSLRSSQNGGRQVISCHGPSGLQPSIPPSALKGAPLPIPNPYGALTHRGGFTSARRTISCKNPAQAIHSVKSLVPRAVLVRPSILPPESIRRKMFRCKRRKKGNDEEDKKGSKRRKARKNRRDRGKGGKSERGTEEKFLRRTRSGVKLCLYEYQGLVLWLWVRVMVILLGLGLFN